VSTEIRQCENKKNVRRWLHCMMVELIDDFFAEHPATASSDKVDTGEADEVIDAIAKTIAELTSQRDGVIRQQVIEQLMQQIMHYDGEFRREEGVSPQAALTRSTDHPGFLTPPPCWTGGGGHLAVRKDPFKNTDWVKLGAYLSLPLNSQRSNEPREAQPRSRKIEPCGFI
jgi:hypothetical protein